MTPLGDPFGQTPHPINPSVAVPLSLSTTFVTERYLYNIFSLDYNFTLHNTYLHSIVHNAICDTT